MCKLKTLILTSYGLQLAWFTLRTVASSRSQSQNFQLCNSHFKSEHFAVNVYVMCAEIDVHFKKIKCINDYKFHDCVLIKNNVCCKVDASIAFLFLHLSSSEH